MTIKTRNKYLLKLNDGTKAVFEFDGTTLTLAINGTTAAAWTIAGESEVATVLPAVDATYDQGSASFQWRDLYVSRNIINSGGFFQASKETGITAHSGGTQAAGYALTKQFNFISTVAAVGDSVLLPTSVAGREVYIYNGGANAAQVFGASTDTINGVATATGVPLPAGTGATFRSNATGTWLCGDITPPMPFGKYNAAANTTNFTATGAQFGGAQEVVLDCTGALGSGQTITPPTVANLIAAIPNAFVGQTYRLRIMGRGAGAFAWTVGAQTGYTLTGTMTIAQNTYREFLVTLTSLAAVVLQSLGQVIVA